MNSRPDTYINKDTADSIANLVERDQLVQRLTGRAAFLRDRGEIKTPELLEESIIEIDRLNIQCEGLYTSAINNGQALILAEAKVESLLNALREAHSMLLWCERRMMSPSLAEYPRREAERIAQLLR
jgi:hypothetical protein